MRRYDVFCFNSLDVSVVNALVVPQRVQTAVDPLANVADGLPGRSHVYILNMSLESGQRGQAFVAGLTTEFVHTTWRQKGSISLLIAALA